MGSFGAISEELEVSMLLKKSKSTLNKVVKIGYAKKIIPIPDESAEFSVFICVLKTASGANMCKTRCLIKGLQNLGPNLVINSLEIILAAAK